jgi:hypothetical protein
MGQVYQCSWRICREIKVPSRFECHMFYVLYPFVTHLLTLPRIFKWCCKFKHQQNWWPHPSLFISFLRPSSSYPDSLSLSLSAYSGTCCVCTRLRARFVS